jgi:hypothetical protein
VVTPNGRTIPIPEGWEPVPARRGDGVVFQRPGASGDADSIRIMNPSAKDPYGYLRYYNRHGQALDAAGHAGNPAGGDATHIPLDGRPIPGLWGLPK